MVLLLFPSYLSQSMDSRGGFFLSRELFANQVPSHLLQSRDTVQITNGIRSGQVVFAGADVGDQLLTILLGKFVVQD